MIRLAIKSDGFQHKVVNAETGEEVEFVQSIRILAVKDDFATATIRIALPTVNIDDSAVFPKKAE